MMDELNGGASVESSPEPAVSSSEPAPPPPSEPVSTPSSGGETESAPVLPSTPESSPSEPSVQEPEGTPSGNEVISVSDLLDILTQAGEEGAEDAVAEEPAEEESAPSEDSGWAEDTPVYSTVGDGSISVEGMQEVLQRLETLEAAAVHPMMETPFEDYTVTEGLLLLVFVILLLDFFLNLIRRWF